MILNVMIGNIKLLEVRGETMSLLKDIFRRKKQIKCAVCGEPIQNDFKTKSDENWKINYIKEFNEMRAEYERKI